MLLIRAKLAGRDPEKGIALESVPSKIKALIQKNPDEHFEFVIGELEDDPKKAKKAKYKNQKKIHTNELKGKKFTLNLKDKDVTVVVDKEGYVKIETSETFLPIFTDFLNEKADNIKKATLFGYSVKVYCLGTEIKISCEDEVCAEKIVKKLKNNYHSVILDNADVKINLLPSEILRLFLKKHE